MKIFSVEGKLYRILLKMTNLIYLNLLCLVFSLPVITVGASLTALYRCIFRLDSEEHIVSAKSFWKAFRQNFSKSTLLFLIFLPFNAIIIYEIYMTLLLAEGGSFFVRFLRLIQVIAVTAVASYTYPLQAQYENTVGATIKNACILSVVHFPSTLIFLISSLFFPILAVLRIDLFLQILPLWFAFGLSLPAWINSRLLNRIFIQYGPTE